MAEQIIQQPDGKYCVYTTIVDNITEYNLSRDEVLQRAGNTPYDKFRMKRIVDMLDAGEKPYYQFTKTYEQILEWVKEVHGSEEVADLRRCIESTPRK